MKNVFFFCVNILEYLGIWNVIIDIKNDEITLLEAVRFFFFHRVISIKSEKFNNSDDLTSNIERFLKNSTTHKIRNVTLTVSITSVSTLFLSYPVISKDKLKRVVTLDIEKNIPIPIRDVYYNYRIESGKINWNVLAFISKKEDIDQFVEVFKKLKINVYNIYYLPAFITYSLRKKSSQNAAGYIIISMNAVDLYILLESSVIKYSGYTGNFEDVDNITIRNIGEFFSVFLKQKIITLDKILVINKAKLNPDRLMASLAQTLNIRVVPAGKTDFINHKDEIEDHPELIGFLNKRDASMEIAPLSIKNERQWRTFSRAAVIFIIVLDILAGAFYPSIISAKKEYSLLEKAQSLPVEQIKDGEVKSMALKWKDVNEIYNFKTKQKELLKKIAEVKSSGIESSNIKLVLTEIARMIPAEVSLKTLNINNLKGEMEGLSGSSDGLESFVVSLAGSKTLNSVVLQKADLIKEKNNTTVHFNISFGVAR